MHQKKIPRVKNILHSIPILHSSGYATTNNRSIVIKNTHLRYVSSSIPLACSVALLLLSICIVSPSSNPFISHADVYAEEGVGEGSTSTRSAEEPDPVATLNITGDLTQTNNIGPNQTIYRTHGIKVNLQDVTDYTLQVSYANGNNSLVYEGTNTGNNTITGANNIQGSSLGTNTWGYAWSDNDKEDDANLYYQTMPTYGSASNGILKNESVSGTDEVLTKTVNGKLVFAAKFADDAPYGHYKTAVLLSLAATPKKVTTTGFGGITNMQEMTASICSTATIGDTGTLLDMRDDSEYSVTKLEDGRCWMTQNLRITGDSIKAKDSSNTTGKITSTDSNVSSDYTVPVSSDPWQGTTAQNSQALVHYAENETNGAYYTWCAATAGSCSSATIANAIASSSICPKGWRLPTKTKYDNLLNIAGVSNDATGSSKLNNPPYNFLYSGTIYDNAVGDIGTVGGYWSSTAAGNDSAYGLNVYTDAVFTDDGSGLYRWAGLSVRCVAMNAEDEKEQEEAIKNTPVDNWADVEYMQQMSPQACTQATTATSSNYNTVKKTLKDSRDNSTYDVAKLDDGKCWMTQNLKLDISKANSLNSNNTNLAEGSEWPLKNLEGNNFTNSNTNPAWSNGTGLSSTNGGPYNSTYGYYYNWCAATAESCNKATTKNAIANSSICPRGWSLPTMTEYNNLLTKASLSVSKIQGAPYIFPTSGFVSDTILYNAASGGYYWSKVASDVNNAYALRFVMSSIGGGYTNGRSDGLSVRCIAGV